MPPPSFVVAATRSSGTPLPLIDHLFYLCSYVPPSFQPGCSRASPRLPKYMRLRTWLVPA